MVELATARPASTGVLYRHRIEFCAGTSRSVGDACREAGLDVGTLLAEVEREESGTDAAAASWSTRPVGDLVDHLRVTFHAVEQREMSRLQQLFELDAGKAARAQREALIEAFGRFRQELTEHMAKEETVLFPWIQSGRGDLARTPIQVMMMEHEATLRLLNHLRDLTQAFADVGHGSEAARALCAALADLDRHVREHMHLENNILFPRALRGEE